MGPEQTKQGSDQPAKELGVAALMLLVLVPFSTQISDIFVDPSDPGFGSQDFPKLIVWLGIALSVALGAKSLWSLRKMRGERRLRLSQMPGPVLLFGVAGLYIYAIGLFQYALPTLALLIFLTIYFGNKGWKRTVLVPICSVCVYYFVFFILFGIFEERGTFLSYDSYGFARSVRSLLGLN
ncbi:MAG: tripartite tricarboxylate transporter TctB family protein [Pseudomonadota bacterium]